GRRFGRARLPLADLLVLAELRVPDAGRLARGAGIAALAPAVPYHAARSPVRRRGEQGDRRGEALRRDLRLPVAARRPRSTARDLSPEGVPATAGGGSRGFPRSGLGGRRHFGAR